MKNIIVLGAGGFIGFNLCEQLCKDPENYVIGVDRIIDNIPRCVPLHVKFDLTNPKMCEMLFEEYEFDDIYQFAADSGKIEYLNSKDYNYGTSTLINLNIIRSLKNKKFNKIVFPSSDYARDFELNDYGLEKKYNEQLYKRSNLPIIIITLSNVYGVWDTGIRNEKVLNALCRRTAEAKFGSTIQVKNDGRLRSFVYIDDAVNVIINTEKDMDIKARESMSLVWFCKLLSDVSRKSILYSFDNYYPVDFKVNKDFIYTKDLKEGITEVYNWYLERTKYESNSNS